MVSARFHGSDDEINLDTEHPRIFLDWRCAAGATIWSTTSYLFKREVYTAVVKRFADIRERLNTARDVRAFARLA